MSDQDDVIARGERVKRLLDDPDFKAAFAACRSACMQNMSMAANPEEAWVAVAHVQAVDRIWGSIRAYWQQGEAEMQALVAEQRGLQADTREQDSNRARLQRATDARAEWDLQSALPWERN